MDPENSNEQRSNEESSYILYGLFMLTMYCSFTLDVDLDKDPNDQRFIDKTSYKLYMFFILSMFFSLIRFKQKPPQKSLIMIMIAFLFYFINFLLVSYGPQQNISMVFYIIFYATMISASGFQLYFLEHFHQQLKAYEDYLPL